MTTLSARPLRAMFAGLLIASLLPATLHAQRRTENVVLIVTDGVRWQDVFRGPERRLMSSTPGGVGDTSALIRDFWRDDPVQRRATLLPFLWSTVAKQGVLYGNQDRGSVARITNRFKFSYPGYSGKVGAVATWSVFRNILNEERAGIDVIDGWDEPFPGALGRDPRRVLVNELYRTSLRYWPGNAFDAPMQLAAKEYIRLHKPRLLFVGYGETDEWAHGRRYDLTLRSLHQVDAFVADLWRVMQGIRQYRGRTTFIITTDHGRGGSADDWTSHGERVTQSQVAATIAALLGKEDAYRAASPRSAPAVREALSRPRR